MGADRCYVLSKRGTNSTERLENNSTVHVRVRVGCQEELRDKRVRLDDTVHDTPQGNISCHVGRQYKQATLRPNALPGAERR